MSSISYSAPAAGRQCRFSTFDLAVHDSFYPFRFRSCLHINPLTSMSPPFFSVSVPHSPLSTMADPGISRKTITSLLNSGVTVLVDRYYHSGIVYSAATQNPPPRWPGLALPRSASAPGSCPVS